MDLEPIWEANSRQLEASIDKLKKLPGYSRARAEIYERSEPIRLELGKGVPSQAKAIEFFDAHASALLELVTDPVSRDAYLEVLMYVYYPETCVLVFGFRPESYALRFGGGFARPSSQAAVQSMEAIDARLRFWQAEAFKRGGDVMLPTTPDLESDDPGLVSRPVWAKIKALDSEFRTRVNQGVVRATVVCESLQKCFDILVEDHLDQGRSLPFQTLRRAIPDSLLLVAIELEWLPAAMAPHIISWGHREWLMRLLDGRIAYFEATELGKPFGHEYPRPDFVVIPVPETDPLMQWIESEDRMNELLKKEAKVLDLQSVRRGVEARGFTPDNPGFDDQVELAIGDLAKKYGGKLQIVSRIKPSTITTQPHPRRTATSQAARLINGMRFPA